jgi:hypothetical protein
MNWGLETKVWYNCYSVSLFKYSFSQNTWEIQILKNALVPSMQETQESWCTAVAGDLQLW